MASGHVSDLYKNNNTTDFNLSNSSVFSKTSHDNEDFITPHAQPVSPSAIDFSKISMDKPNSYKPGSQLDPSSLQTKSDSRALGNGSIGYLKEKEEITFSQSNTRSERDEHEDRQKDDEKEKTRNKKKIRYVESARFIVAAVFIAIVVIAVIAVTIEYETPPKTRTAASSVDFKCILNPNNTSSAGKLRFNTTIEITCDYSEKLKDKLHNSSLLMKFKPEYYFLQTQNTIEFNHSLQTSTFRTGRWEIGVSSGRIKILGDSVKCGGDGRYDITLLHPIQKFEDEVGIKIESETSNVQLEVGQSEADGQYLITCSSASDCTPAPISLLGTFNNTAVPLYGVNFTCVIKYNDYDGWSASCTGSIPKSVISSIDEITCRPILKNEDEAKITQAKVSKDVLLCNDDKSCSFECPIANQDRYYSDPKFCNIFHRCVDERLYTAPCPTGTYFSTQTCVCSHIDDVINCNSEGIRLMAGSDKKLCTDSTAVGR